MKNLERKNLISFKYKIFIEPLLHSVLNPRGLCTYSISIKLAQQHTHALLTSPQLKCLVYRQVGCDDKTKCEKSGIK